MSGYTNEDGEPIMDGASWRFEQDLDDQFGYDDDFDRDYYDDED